MINADFHLKKIKDVLYQSHFSTEEDSHLEYQEKEYICGNIVSFLPRNEPRLSGDLIHLM